jgi:septal ring factor EnvC (AmiA/AmiB activator)
MVAELRIARTDADKAKASLEEQTKTLKEEQDTVEARDKLISEQTDKIAKLKADLKESVMKTRELRAELSDRAAENIKSEVRLRDVETELSVAQASTDLIATGVLDYTTDVDAEDDAERPRRRSSKP